MVGTVMLLLYFRHSIYIGSGTGLLAMMSVGQVSLSKGIRLQQQQHQKQQQQQKKKKKDDTTTTLDIIILIKFKYLPSKWQVRGQNWHNELSH